MKFFATLAILLLPVGLFAQQGGPGDPEVEKKFRESVDKQVEDLTRYLELDDAQVFWVDSILTHDFTAMREELTDLNKAKVGNADLFYAAQDKWQEKIYNAFRKILDDNQWEKYLKSGARKEKKARDKREAKRNKQ